MFGKEDVMTERCKDKTSGLMELAHYVEGHGLGNIKTRDLRHCIDSTNK